MLSQKDDCTSIKNETLNSVHSTHGSKMKIGTKFNKRSIVSVSIDSQQGGQDKYKTENNVLTNKNIA